ncbi:glycosyltransferase family 32 protein [Barnesiella viscericola]|uniref:glycosyltransferase family 32 protein n=1 Tax=Barnesiella viscericola TaxID=397865 RepID=UPI002357823F|nr:glycosyltransferase [Barnesiella viscericola]
MIPKVIHYCWFSGEKKPRLIRRCIRSWKKVLPDYEIKCWDANSFDFESVPYVKQAYERKKWAFVADYVRLYALYTEGGIYLDSDVEVYKSFDEFLKYSFFTGTDVNDKRDIYAIEPAIMGAENGLLYLKECLDYYKQLQFVKSDGSMDLKVMPYIISPLLEKYGYRSIDKTQYLSHNIVVFSSAYFANRNVLNYSNLYARHWNAASWANIECRGKIFHFFYRCNLMYFYKVIEKLFIRLRS